MMGSLCVLCQFNATTQGEEQMDESLTQEDINDLREKAAKHVWLPYTPVGQHGDTNVMQIFVEADGIRVTDVEGKSYIDAFSGLMYKNVGHGRQEIVDAVHEQLQKMSSVPMFYDGTIPSILLAAKLAEITPGDLSRVHYVSGGSEANEVAIKVAKQYHRLSGSPDRYKVIARQGEYHGFTHMTMALGKSGGFYSVFEPLTPGVRHIPQPYCYRCPLALSYPDCGVACAKSLESTIENEGPHTVAAFLTASISQQTPVAVPPAEYWPMIRSICDRYGVLLIDDEVVCGFGRTGKWFGIENWDVVPDIMAMAKGITSGYQPLGAVIASEKISETFEKSEDVLRNVTTYGGMPGSCAAGLANLTIFEEEGLIEKSASMGKYISDRLQPLNQHPMVGDIRGMGMFWGIEMVKDKETKEPINARKDVATLTGKLTDLGLITRADNGTIRFMPPLVTTEEEVDEAVGIVEEAISHLETELL
jgi:adenosylmethionine-8-amino-7-oxononanoate aminotransferase|tara:strand:+ start:3116 stop:4543 length:1428 start_codon:yes stop_codon:yes gene_type:complete